MDFVIGALARTSGLRAVTSAGQHIALGGGEGDQVRIVNLGPNPVAVLDGDGTQTAAFPTDAATSNGKGSIVPNGVVEVFTLSASSTDLHFISRAAETATVSINRTKGP